MIPYIVQCHGLLHFFNVFIFPFAFFVYFLITLEIVCSVNVSRILANCGIPRLSCNFVLFLSSVPTPLKFQCLRWNLQGNLKWTKMNGWMWPLSKERTTLGSCWGWGKEAIWKVLSLNRGVECFNSELKQFKVFIHWSRSRHISTSCDNIV